MLTTHRRTLLCFLGCFALVAAGRTLAQDGQPGVVTSEFVFTTASFPSCHASTIAETPSGLVAAWFGGTHEKHKDVGVWVSRHANNKWSPPVVVANGVQEVRADRPELGVIVITHFQRLLEHLRPDHVHILVDGRIVASGGMELVEQLEADGYEGFR